MKLSIFTTVKDPHERGDTVNSSLSCYADLADELVVVDGSSNPTDVYTFRTPVTMVHSEWPTEFSWKLIGSQFQKGYEACTGDAVIHADIDFLFHENDFKSIRQAAQRMLDEHEPAVSLFKHQFVLPDRYNLKSRLVIMVNKRDFGDRIRFDSGGDLCQPSLDGVHISPESVPEAGIAFYNYEKMLKTEAQIKEDVGRMERAYERHFGKTQYGSDGTDDNAYKIWVRTQKGKFGKPQQIIPLSQHPKYIQEAIQNLSPDQWGYDGLGSLERNIYA